MLINKHMLKKLACIKKLMHMRRRIYWILLSKSSNIPLNCGYLTIEWIQVKTVVAIPSLL